MDDYSRLLIKKDQDINSLKENHEYVLGLKLEQIKELRTEIKKYENIKISEDSPPIEELKDNDFFEALQHRNTSTIS